MSIGKRSIAILSTLLLAIFAWYWSGVTLFSHEHLVDGQRVMHSHPFAGNSHNHSSSQIQTISYLAMFIALAAPMSYALCKFDGFKSEIAINLTEKVVIANKAAYSLRAPPATLL